MSKDMFVVEELGSDRLAAGSVAPPAGARDHRLTEMPDRRGALGGSHMAGQPSVT